MFASSRGEHFSLLKCLQRKTKANRKRRVKGTARSCWRTDPATPPACTRPATTEEAAKVWTATHSLSWISLKKARLSVCKRPCCTQGCRWTQRCWSTCKVSTCACSVCRQTCIFCSFVYMDLDWIQSQTLTGAFSSSILCDRHIMWISSIVTVFLGWKGHFIPKCLTVEDIFLMWFIHPASD